MYHYSRSVVFNNVKAPSDPLCDEAPWGPLAHLFYCFRVNRGDAAGS